MFNAVCLHTPIPATAPALLYLPPSVAVASLPPYRGKEHFMSQSKVLYILNSTGCDAPQLQPANL